MKKCLLMLAIVLGVHSTQAQLFKKVLGGGKDSSGNSTSSVINSVLKGKPSTGGLTNDEIVSGLKEALSVGAQNSGNKLSAVDGFFKDAAIKILGFISKLMGVNY